MTAYTGPTYDIGDRRKLICEVYDEAGVLADPSILTFQMREPDGILTAWVYGTDSEVVKDSVGVYHVHWDCTQSGKHYWRYAASGTIGAAEETVFAVRSSKVLTDPIP